MVPGYSVGRWEGDELVVETVGLDSRAWSDQLCYPKRKTRACRSAIIGSIATTSSEDILAPIDDQSFTAASATAGGVKR